MRSQERRSARSSDRSYNTGPFIGRIVSHLDQKFMGALQVQILNYNDTGDDYQASNEVITCFYAPPFYGATPSTGLQGGTTYAESTQSYGMWFVPPDVGSKVLVMLIEGRRDFGYWFACVPEEFMNFMIPDGRASTLNTTANADLQSEIPEMVAAAEGLKVPVGEYNRATIDPAGETQPTNYPKPRNDLFIERLTEQGLLADDIRGTTSTSARREVPSMVFGVSTPGPMDKRPNAPTTNIGTVQNEINVPSSRLGGSSIVMDDGDDKFVRVGPADSTPSEYIDREYGSTTEGDVTIPANELIRMRTRTGHQILLHNSEDLIYIGNARGTSWIEMTSNGKIDIYANDSISVHSENDLNFSADRDINFECRNMNMVIGGTYKNSTSKSHSTTSGEFFAVKAGDSITHDAGTFISDTAQSGISHSANSGSIGITESGEICIDSDRNINVNSADNFNLTTGLNFNLKSTGGIFLTSTEADLHLFSQQRMNINTNAVMNLRSESTMNLHTKSNMNTQVDGKHKSTADLGFEFFTPIAYNVWAEGNMNLKVDGDILSYSNGNTYIKSNNYINLQSTNDINVKSSQAIRINPTGALSLYSGNNTVYIDGTTDVRINEGGSTAANTADTARQAEEVTVFAPEAYFASEATQCATLPPVNPFEADLLARKPMHEPWAQHENLNPLLYTPERTEAGQPSEDSFKTPIADTFINIGKDRGTADTTVSTTTNRAIEPLDEGGDIGDDVDLDLVGLSDNVEFAFNYLKQQLNLTDAQAAGIVGNIRVESYPEIRPQAYNGAGGGLGARGIVQWRGDRIRKFRERYNKDILEASLQEQLDYLIWEITDPTSPEAWAKTLERLRETRTPAEAARSFEATFERSGGHNLTTRVRYAEEVYLAAQDAFELVERTEPGSPPHPDVRIERGEVVPEGESDVETNPNAESRSLSGDAGDIVIQQNRACSRRFDISPQLERILRRAAAAAGITKIYISSAGQAPKGHPNAVQGRYPNGNRVRNSTRHDCITFNGESGYAHAADIDLYQGNTILDGRNSSHQAILRRFLQVCVQQGVKGFGWDSGSRGQSRYYMGPCRFHVDLYGFLSYCPGPWSTSRGRANPSGRVSEGPIAVWGDNMRTAPTACRWVRNGNIISQRYDWFPRAVLS